MQVTTQIVLSCICRKGSIKQKRQNVTFFVVVVVVAGDWQKIILRGSQRLVFCLKVDPKLFINISIPEKYTGTAGEVAQVVFPPSQQSSCPQFLFSSLFSSTHIYTTTKRFLGFHPFFPESPLYCLAFDSVCIFTSLKDGENTHLE